MVIDSISKQTDNNRQTNKYKSFCRRINRKIITDRQVSTLVDIQIGTHVVTHMNKQKNRPHIYRQIELYGLQKKTNDGETEYGRLERIKQMRTKKENVPKQKTKERATYGIIGKKNKIK